MKKIQVNSAKLQLNKQKISNLTNNQMENLNGGQNNAGLNPVNPGNPAVGFSAGCSDGCGPFQTAWNCTRVNCSADCTIGSSLATFLC